MCQFWNRYHILAKVFAVLIAFSLLLY